jgi:uncharacterized membrane protein
MFELVFQLLLFLLSFLLVFGTLNKLRIFNRNLNAVIALVVAFYVISASFLFTEDVQKILAYFGILVIIVFGAILAYTSSGLREKKKK